LAHRTEDMIPFISVHLALPPVKWKLATGPSCKPLIRT
jgi:hypothetical protein